MDLDLTYKEYELSDYAKTELLNIYDELSRLTLNESVDYLSGILCEEWHTYTDQRFIAEVLYLLSEKIRIMYTKF